MPKKASHHYSREQKIVAAVWYHEKMYTGLTNEAIRKNFEIRFQKDAPKSVTISSWEQRLFREGLTKHYNRRNVSRLVHVPYVRESLNRHPNMSLRERARILGLSFSMLLKIIKVDLKEYEKEEISKLNTQLEKKKENATDNGEKNS